LGLSQATFLKSIKNEKNVPLYYILRDQNEERDHRNNQGELGAAIYDAAHEGQLYLRDAFQVNQYLDTWVGTGHALTHIRDIQDIQERWENLLLHYEGPDAINTLVDAARAALERLKYSGDRHHFNFDNYCERFLHHSNVLSRHGRNLNGLDQVSQFLRNIKCDNNQEMEFFRHLKLSVRTNNDTRDNLNRAIIWCKEQVQLEKPQGTIQPYRRMGAQHTDFDDDDGDENYNDDYGSSGNQHGGYGRGGRGRSYYRYSDYGRGRGRGRRGGRGSGRGYRGGGRGGRGGREGRQNDDDDGLGLPLHIFNMLTKEQKDFYTQARENQRNRNASDNGNDKDTRQASGTQTKPPEEQQRTKERSASSQFGSTGARARG